MSSDKSRDAILARRKQFIAAAMTSVSIACGKSTVTADAGSTPEPCLSVSIQDLDAAVPPVPDPNPDPTPHPCLKIALPPNPDAGPRVCLKPPIKPIDEPGCDPPFFVDAEGRKHYKPSCLK